jgi:hypothetical protein
MAIPAALFKAGVIPQAPACLVMSGFPCNRIDRQAHKREIPPMIIAHPERNLA